MIPKIVTFFKLILTITTPCYYSIYHLHIAFLESNIYDVHPYFESYGKWDESHRQAIVVMWYTEGLDWKRCDRVLKREKTSRNKK